MEYRFDFKKPRKAYRKRNSERVEPIQPAKQWEQREKDIKRLVEFLNYWFDGRVISIDIQKKLQKFGILSLVRNNEIEEAKKILLNS